MKINYYMKQKGLVPIFFLGIVLSRQTVVAQETDYHSVNFQYSMPSSIRIEGPAPKTFDLNVILLGADPIFAARESDAVKSLKKELGENNYTVDFPGLQQVDSTVIGDLHIITILQTLQQKAPLSRGGGIMITNVELYTTISNGEGIMVFTKAFKNDTLSTPYGAGLIRPQVNKLVVENAIGQSLKHYQHLLNGYTGWVTARLADLDGVKKMPDLKAFEDQVKELKPILAKEGVDAFCKAAEKYVPFWQQQADNHLEKNGEEVKRAAYQDLSLYFMLKGDVGKAHEAIEAYKPIDKTVKEMMIIKYKNSEDMEKLLATLYPEKQVLIVSPDDRKIPLKEAVVRFMYLKMEGTVTIDDRKNSGTYTGMLYIKKPVPGEDEKKSNMMLQLDATDFDVTIRYNDNGADKEIVTKLSKVKSLKDKNNANYTVIKGSDNMLGDMGTLSIASDTWILMKETYSSAKISMYRIMLPQPAGSENSMLIRKVGDPKGVRTKLVNFKKNLTDYLADCTATTDLIKQSNNINGDITRILETYSGCN